MPEIDVGLAVDHRGGADDLAHVGLRRRAEPRLGVPVERVREALRGHRRAGVEAEGLPQREGVGAAVPRDRERPTTSGTRRVPAAPGGVRIVEQLRARRVPRSATSYGVVGERRVDGIDVEDRRRCAACRPSAPRACDRDLGLGETGRSNAAPAASAERETPSLRLTAPPFAGDATPSGGRSEGLSRRAAARRDSSTRGRTRRGSCPATSRS